MGYSKNPNSMEEIKRNIDLSELESGISCEWEVGLGEEDYWAYKVREALYLAKLYPKRFPELFLMAGVTKIEIVRAGLIRAKTGAGNTTVVARRGTTVTHGVDTDTIGRAGRMPQLTGKQSVDTIIQAWFDQQPSNNPLYFPDAALSRDDLVKLHRWTSGQGLMFFESQGAITVQRPTADLEGLGWDPSDIEGADESPFWEDGDDA